MHLRISSRASSALVMTLGLASLALGGCGRESLPVDTNPGGSGGAGGASGSGGAAGSSGTGACQPSPEECNGVDDDCNGGVDEGCSCASGEKQSCYSGPPGTIGVGPCKQGTQTCEGGHWSTCKGEIVPAAEKCDAADNNCNGQLDENNPGGGAPCNIGLSGICSKGATKCVGGQFVCGQVVFPMPEQCNSIDDNCDGQTDEGNPGGGTPCDTGLPGPCAQGALSCANGQKNCKPQVFPTIEACDGIDNNCDNLVDNQVPGLGLSCDTGLLGKCKDGFTDCKGAAVTCTPFAAPQNETCNGQDDNCNGVVDDAPGVGVPCNTGKPAPCNTGKTQCQGSSVVCLPDTVAVAEKCDAIDNNCNGQVDEGNPEGGAACMTGLPGKCGPGTTSCKAGLVTCVANMDQSPEICAAPEDENCSGASATVFFSETFANNNAGWTLDLEWQIGAAKAGMKPPFGNPDPGADHTPDNDNGVAGVVIGGNPQSQVQHPFRWLTSPLIPIDPATPEVSLQFWRFLNSDFAPWMTNAVEVFDAQANQWFPLWQSGGNPAITDAAWTRQVFDLTGHAKGGAVRVRFGFNIGMNGAFTVSQWNVDDVAITSEPCQ